MAVLSFFLRFGSKTDEQNGRSESKPAVLQQTLGSIRPLLPEIHSLFPAKFIQQHQA